MKIFTILMGVLLTIGGFACLITPFSTFASVGWLIAIVLMVVGFNIITGYFISRKTGAMSGWDLVGGILTIALAMFILYGHFARVVLDTFIIAIFAVWVLASGFIRIITGLNMKRMGTKSWIWIVIFGGLSLLMGIYGLFNPYIFKFAIGWMLGFFITMQGINLLGVGFTMGSGTGSVE